MNDRSTWVVPPVKVMKFARGAHIDLQRKSCPKTNTAANEYNVATICNAANKPYFSEIFNKHSI